MIPEMQIFSQSERANAVTLANDTKGPTCIAAIHNSLGFYIAPTPAGYIVFTKELLEQIAEAMK